jgi:hypothetical protein
MYQHKLSNNRKHKIDSFGCVIKHSQKNQLAVFYNKTKRYLLPACQRMSAKSRSFFFKQESSLLYFVSENTLNFT